MCKLLEHNLNEKEILLFYGNQLNERHDFRIACNGSVREVDTLLFFDSRGISKQFDNSLVDQIIKNLPSSHTFLLVSRPLEITTWMTLYNFILINKIIPKRIITNMGFVDFTPKKMSIIEKSTCQYDLFFSKDEASVIFLEKYLTKSDGVIGLFQQAYPQKFYFALHNLLNSFNTLILNTPLLVPDFLFERDRPSSFFDSLLLTNNFNHSLKINGKVVDFNAFDNSKSYDGVHYTDKGNTHILECIKRYL
ncbi:MAG: hypothetical protein MH132_10110 [Hydrotalea sp.]|nr:hypothetical protein [Hydrotalea sp.]